MSNAQRALWTFLFYTLAGPFMGAIAVFVGGLALDGFGIVPLAVPLQTDGMPLGTANGPAGAAALAVQTFAIGSFAAAFAGAGLAALVSVRGSVSWLEAAIAGVAAFLIVVLSTGAVSSQLVTGLAFLAACIGILCRLLLMRIGILPPPA